LDETVTANVERQIGRQRRAFEAFEKAHQDTVAGRVVFDFIEEQSRAVFFVLGGQHR
jgi:hypothetical protein